ncbi:MAG TPA: divalent-cation tolerance protein CutA [Cyanobacteria bacterium UBA8156]|nr:divalent-cation tolerance protein CutA [Cyanobacteria bacterium UBA8156]
MPPQDLPVGLPTRLWVVLTTLPDVPTAQAIARTLVHAHLAACAQVLPPMTTIYVWENQLQEETEVLLLLKTTAGTYPALAQRLQELHPYTTPQILAIAAQDVHPPYAQWLQAWVGALPEPPR